MNNQSALLQYKHRLRALLSMAISQQVAAELSKTPVSIELSKSALTILQQVAAKLDKFQ